MLLKIKNITARVLNKINRAIAEPPLSVIHRKIEAYKEAGSIPWSDGYNEFKWANIAAAIAVPKQQDPLPSGFGIGLDERIVEYPWIFANLNNSAGKILDAGSTFNFEAIANHPFIIKKELTIYTYNPEPENFNEHRISYVYGDLRELPFKDNLFDEIVSQSTIEHIDMDNSIYGYSINNNAELEIKSYEYLKVITEMVRVLKKTGVLLLTFPYGKYENHGFFQQLDHEMVDKIMLAFAPYGTFNTTFFTYLKQGWIVAQQSEVEASESFNPHTGRGKHDDGAAHCRTVCCVKFIKN